MSILIIGLVFVFLLLFGKYWLPIRRALLHSWFVAIYRVLNFIPGVRGRLAPWLATLLPIAGLAVVQWHLSHSSDHPILWFGFSTLLLVMAWGAKDLDADVQRFLEAEDSASRAAASDVLTHSYRHLGGEGDEAVIKGIFYQGLIRWFGVLFWFMVAGGAGALLFRMAHVQVGEAPNRDLLSPTQLSSGKGIVSLLDLLPALLSTLALAVVGDFDAVIKAWRKDFKERRLPALTADHEFYPDVGYLAVTDGQVEEDGFRHDYEDDRRLAPINTAMSMVWRALTAWLVVIALLVLSGQLS